MTDPLADLVSLLQPSAPFSKLVLASAPWAVRRTELGRPFYMVLLQGRCRLRIDGAARSDTITLDEGDFALIPSAHAFAASSVDRQPPGADDPVDTPIAPMPGGARVGHPAASVTTRMLVGHCVFSSPDAPLLVTLLPQWLHVRGERRLSTLVQLVADESRSHRLARDMVMARLLEVMLIEALRSTAGTSASAGLVQGLADPRLAKALRSMHERPGVAWTVAQLARAAAMSRSAFYERFRTAVGMAPMAYLLAWRMASAKQMLRQGGLPIAQIAERVGYGSVSAFGVAFTRQVGMPPGRYAKAGAEQPAP